MKRAEPSRFLQDGVLADRTIGSTLLCQAISQYSSPTLNHLNHDPKSPKVRAQLNHPIIETDGHTVEFTPVFFDYIKEVGGAGMIERYQKAVGSGSALG